MMTMIYRFSGGSFPNDVKGEDNSILFQQDSFDDNKNVGRINSSYMKNEGFKGRTDCVREWFLFVIVVISFFKNTSKVRLADFSLIPTMLDY